MVGGGGFAAEGALRLPDPRWPRGWSMNHRLF
jgi:hypothetical protein